ncbi:MAG: MFS transporter [Chloroflexi bacterium]|nr:MFS transporter [Chloroflexota bacterium]
MHFDNETLKRVKRALRHSNAEGMAYGAFIGFGDHYITAYAVALQASSLQIGILCSVPGFLAAAAQLWSVQLTGLFKSRKATVLTFALLQGLMLFPMLALAFGWREDPNWWLIFFAALYSIFGALISPAWGSLMAEIVPDHLRGRYFAVRGKLSTVTTIGAFLAGGIFLNLLVQKALWGFAVLFAAAFAARMISWGFLTRLYEIPSPKQAEDGAGITGFARTLITTSLGTYMLFLFAMSFAVNVGSPYFTVYILRDQEFSYITFAALETVASVVTIVAVTHWGRAADRAGNLKMVWLAAGLIPLVPLLWLPSANRVYLGFAQAFSGFAWAGFNLCSVNYLYDATTSENRTRYLAYFNAGNGLSAGAGALLGGFLLPRLPAVMGYQTLTLLMISGMLRGAVSLAFLPRLKEVRKVSRIPAAELFHIMLGGRPVNRRLSHRGPPHVHDPGNESGV